MVMNKILVTGAMGLVGRNLRSAWAAKGDAVTWSDLLPDGGGAGRYVQADLADRAAVDALVQGIDVIVHLGGISREGSWPDLLASNIEGTYNLYDAARLAGVKRVIFASSLHVTGFYGVDDVLDPLAPPRPSNLYGVTKSFGEALARYYFDKFGIEGLVVRLGTFGTEPNSERMLHTWISDADFAAMLEQAIAMDRLGFQQLYGVSDNDGRWWQNPADSLGGWRPKDNSAAWREALAPTALDRARPEGRFQGGIFTSDPHFDDEAKDAEG